MAEDDDYPRRVKTVLGSKRPAELGQTLTHEHLSLDFSKFYVSPPEHIKNFPTGNLSLSNIGYVRQYPYSSLNNLCFYNVEDAVVADVQSFAEANGKTIVENSSHGLKRNIPLMKNVSELTGVNVIVGTGYYVASTQSASTLNSTKEEMYSLMMKELEEGCLECPSVAAGFIGEVGSSWPIEEFEKRAISATAEVQEQLECSVSFHPGRDPSAPAEIMRIYGESGGDERRTVMSHVDRTFTTIEQLMEFVDDTYCYVQFDLFGTECSFYQLNPLIDMLSDAQRVAHIARLRDELKLTRVLMSHDIHTKHRLTHFGGHGYAHIANNVRPYMLTKGFSEEDLNVIMVKNPRNWLTYWG